MGVRTRLTGPWGLVAALWVTLLAANAYYIVPASVVPVITDRLLVSKTAAGLLVSVMFGVQVLLGVPVGIALDRVDNRRAIALATVALVAVYAWSFRAARAGNFRTLLLARAVAAPVTAVLWTAGVNVIGRSFEAERQATAVGVFSAAPAAGFALGLVTGPLVATTFGWAAVFLAYAGPAVAGSLAYWLVSPGVGTVGGGSDRAELADLRRLLGRRTVWNVALLAFLGFSLYAFVTSWVPSYLSDVLGVSLAGSGLLAALFPAVGALARGGSGAVSDRLFGHRRRPVVLLAFAVSAPAVLLIVLTRTVAVIFLALVLAGLFLQMGVGLVYSLAHEIADPTVAATGVAVTTSMATFGGFTAPLIGGLLIEGSGYPAAFGYAVVAGVAGLALAWFTPEPGGPG